MRAVGPSTSACAKADIETTANIDAEKNETAVLRFMEFSRDFRLGSFAAKCPCGTGIEQLQAIGNQQVKLVWAETHEDAP